MLTKLSNSTLNKTTKAVYGDRFGAVFSIDLSQPKPRVGHVIVWYTWECLMGKKLAAWVLAHAGSFVYHQCSFFPPNQFVMLVRFFTNEGSAVGFFYFPRDKKQRQTWVLAMCSDKWQPLDTDRICGVDLRFSQKLELSGLCLSSVLPLSYGMMLI